MAEHVIRVDFDESGRAQITADITAVTWNDLVPLAVSQIFTNSTLTDLFYYKNTNYNFISRVLFRVNTLFLNNSTVDSVTIKVPFVKRYFSRTTESFKIMACTLTDVQVGPCLRDYLITKNQTEQGRAEVFSSIGSSISNDVTIDFSGSVADDYDHPVEGSFNITVANVNKTGYTYFWLVLKEDGDHILPTSSSLNGSTAYLGRNSISDSSSNYYFERCTTLTSISTSVAQASGSPSGSAYVNNCTLINSYTAKGNIEVSAPLSAGTSAIAYYRMYSTVVSSWQLSGRRATIDNNLDYRGVLPDTAGTTFHPLSTKVSFSAVTVEGLEGPPTPYTILTYTDFQINPPTNLRSVSQTASTLSIAWDAPVGGDPFTKYIVKWRSPLTGSVCYTSADLPTTQTTYTIDVPVDIRSNFNVFVFAASNTKASSHNLGASLLNVVLDPGGGGGGTTPSAPTNVTISNIQQNSATITAQQPNSIGSGIKQYNIYLTNVYTNTLLPVIISNINPYFPFNLLNLTANTEYSVQISLTDTNNVEGPKSAAVTFATPTGDVWFVYPTPPQNVVATVGSTPNSIKVTWDAPAEAYGTLVDYRIVNKIDGSTKVILVSSGVREAEFYPVNYGTTYTFGAKASNENGYSPEAISNPITLTAPQTAPSVPRNIRVSVVAQKATVTWEAPASNGGSPITHYKVSLFSNQSTTPAISIVNSSTFTFTLEGLAPDTTYYYAIAATNSTVIPYVYGPEGLSISFKPSQSIEGAITVREDYNYKKFYSAPIILDKNSLNYGDYVYPETVVNVVPSSISNNDVQLPIEFTTNNNVIVLRYQKSGDVEKKYLIPLNQTVYSSFDALVNELQITTGATAGGSKVYPVVITGLVDRLNEQNRLLMESIDTVDVFLLSEENPVIVNSIEHTNVNAAIFGESPVYFNGYDEYLVENHIPTTVYDNKNEKALVESLPIITKKDLPVVYKGTNGTQQYPYIELTTVATQTTQPLYGITIENTPLRPTKVDVFWYNVNNQYTHLVDYDGDGILREKIKSIDEFGNVTFTYEPSTTAGYGQVNYTRGTISNLILKDYRPASILGVNAKFPLSVKIDDRIILNVRGSLQTIPIPAATYSVNSLITYLNSTGVLPTYQLTAGYKNGQIYIVNNKLGPNETLSLDNISTGSLNFAIFGFTPILTSPPRIYISYSFSLNQSDKYQYIWYQTPHFVIKVKNKTDEALFTQAHLSYVLDKIKKFKPATTVLDGIEVDIDLADTANIYESLEVLEYPLIKLPYIIIDLTPPMEAPMIIGPNDVQVTNPDDQLDILEGGYTYLSSQ